MKVLWIGNAGSQIPRDWSASRKKCQGALRAGAGSAGRDNDPGGLGYMPDSHGPNMAESQNRDECFGSPKDSPSGASSPSAPS